MVLVPLPSVVYNKRGPRVAQKEEHVSAKHKVVGSRPIPGTTPIFSVNCLLTTTLLSAILYLSRRMRSYFHLSNVGCEPHTGTPMMQERSRPWTPDKPPLSPWVFSFSLSPP